MGWESEKTVQKRLLKRYSSFSENYASDSESNKLKTRKYGFDTVFNTPSKVKSSMERFTPYTKIPAIGEKVQEFKNIDNKFKLNYHSDININRRYGAMSSKIPVYRSQSVTKNKIDAKLNLKTSHLLRRNTYIVLEPIVCVKNSERQPKASPTKQPLNVTYTKLKKQNIGDVKEKSIVFGTKLFNTFDSDSDVYASDEMSPSSEKEVRKSQTNLNTLNYLLHNLKLSRNTESDLLLPKNNPCKTRSVNVSWLAKNRSLHKLGLPFPNQDLKVEIPGHFALKTGRSISS